MSISITINNINTLSDTERTVLRLIADRQVYVAPEWVPLTGKCNEASVADTLKQTVRGIAAQPAPVEAPAPIEPTEVFSPLTQVTGMPATPAPVATVPTPPAVPTNPNLDANGLPWDKRIHSSSRAKVADGRWRYARNLAPGVREAVEAELRAVQAIPVPVATQTVIGVDVANGPDATAAVEFTDGAVTSATVTPTGWPFGTGTPEEPVAIARADGKPMGAPAAPVVPLPPTVPAAPTALPMTFAQLMQHVTPLLVSGKLTQPLLQGVVEKCGLPHLAALGARPDLVETVKAAIDEAVGGVQ